MSRRKAILYTAVSGLRELRALRSFLCLLASVFSEQNALKCSFLKGLRCSNRLRVVLCIYFFVGLFLQLAAQQLFPVKINQRWGLMNSEGKIVREPIYDAISEFKRWGMAVMQREGGVGLLGPEGEELIPPLYQDIKVLHPRLVSVMQDDQWMVLDLNARVILEPGFRQLLMYGEYLAYEKGGRWGLLRSDGEHIAPPVYDFIRQAPFGYFFTERENLQGLLDANGTELLRPEWEHIRLPDAQLFICRKANEWYLKQKKAKPCTQKFSHYQLLDSTFILLYQEENTYLYSRTAGKIVASNGFDGFYSFSDKRVLAKKRHKIGLIDDAGKVVLKPVFDEVQAFAKDIYRVRIDKRWALARENNTLVLPFEWDYISPLEHVVAYVLKNGKQGLVNFLGELLLPPEYDYIEVKGERVKAYQNSSLSLFYLTENGALSAEQNYKKHISINIGLSEEEWMRQQRMKAYQNNYALDKFEWFYAPQKDRWGLRERNTGKIVLEPSFDRIKIEHSLGFTLVGVRKTGQCDFERTTYRFNMVFGLVDNLTGSLISPVNMWDIRLEDFRKNLSVARVIFDNGKHGLITKSGQIIARDYTYIGDFCEGRARMALGGRLSGSLLPEFPFELGRLQDYLEQQLSPNYMLDFTHYDLEFEQYAYLVCEDCSWGYLDESGRVKVAPKYTFAQDFLNGVGIVACRGKWGTVNAEGKELVPCQYDMIQFLDNTNNHILRVYKAEEKYGLIDTLGQLTVKLKYDEIGSFREGLLAVKTNGLWGFVDAQGKQRIACKYRAVSDFSEGLAAVKIGRYWGYINEEGEEVIPARFLRCGDFKEGKAWFYENGKYGYINRRGEVLIRAQYERAHDFEGGLARIMLEKHYGLIDSSGKILLRPRYVQIYPFDPRYGVAKVAYGNDRLRYGLINRRGELITASTGYREIHPFSEGLAAVKLKDQYGFIAPSGKLAIPARFSKVSDFSEGRAVVQLNGRCGYIDRRGNVVIQPSFSRCLDFHEGKAVVYMGNRRAGLIDVDGNMLIEPGINRLYHFSGGHGLVRDANYRFYYITEKAGAYDGYYDDASPFQHGVAVVQIGDKWGVINARGMEVIPPKYDEIENFQNGYAKVRIKGFHGLLKLNGQTIVQPDYEYISYAGQGLFRVEQGNKVGYFNAEGEWVWELSK